MLKKPEAKHKKLRNESSSIESPFNGINRYVIHVNGDSKKILAILLQKDDFFVSLHSPLTLRQDLQGPD
jgi:hypothetical protein